MFSESAEDVYATADFDAHKVRVCSIWRGIDYVKLVTETVPRTDELESVDVPLSVRRGWGGLHSHS